MAGDHKQIPKSILEMFCDKSTRVYGMDITNHIDHYLISDVNAEIGYYSDYVEKKVLKTREDAFGRIRKAINSFIKGKGTVDFNKKNNDIILDYFKISWFRSEKMIRDIQKESKAMHLIDEKPQNIVLTFFNNVNFDKIKLISNLYFNVLINETNVDFVIPQKQFYSVLEDNSFFL